MSSLPEDIEQDRAKVPQFAQMIALSTTTADARWPRWPRISSSSLLFSGTSLTSSPLLPNLSHATLNPKPTQKGRKCIERIFGTLLGSTFGLFGVLFHNPFAATFFAFASGLCGELLVTQAGFDCAGKLVAVTYVSVAFPSFWRLGFPRVRGELRVAMVDAFTRTVAAVMGVVLVTILSIVWFPRTGSDRAAASTADLVASLRKVAEAAFDPLVGGARPRPAPSPDSDLESDDEGYDEEGVDDEVQEDDETEAEAEAGAGGTGSSSQKSSASPSRRPAKLRFSGSRSSLPHKVTGKNKQQHQHRQLPTASDLLPAFAAPKPPGSRPRARERHRDEVSAALFVCSSTRDRIRDSLAAAKNELVVARVPSVPVVVRGTVGACLPKRKTKEGGEGAATATANGSKIAAAVDVEAAPAANGAGAAVALSAPTKTNARSKSLDSGSSLDNDNDNDDPAAKKGPKAPLHALSHGKPRLSRHPVYLPLFLTKKRSAIAFMHRLLPHWVHANPSLHPRAVSDAANAAMNAARALWLAGDAAAGGFPAHLVELMKTRYSKIASPHGTGFYERGDAVWVMDIARILVLDAIAEAESAARAAAAAYRHGALADAVVGRGAKAALPPNPPSPSWPALRRLQEELLWMRDARMIQEAEERLTIDAVQSGAERQREQAAKQEAKKVMLTKMRSEASASTAAAAALAVRNAAESKGLDSLLEEGGTGSGIPRASVAATSAAKARWMALLFALGDVRDAFEALAAALEAWLAATGAPRGRAEVAKVIEWHGHSYSFGSSAHGSGAAAGEKLAIAE